MFRIGGLLRSINPGNVAASVAMAMLMSMLTKLECISKEHRMNNKVEEDYVSIL